MNFRPIHSRLIRPNMPLPAARLSRASTRRTAAGHKCVGKSAYGVGTFPPGNGLSGALSGDFMKPGPYGPFPYSPIIRRPPLEWPGDARVALWVVPNIEFFSLET